MVTEVYRDRTARPETREQTDAIQQLEALQQRFQNQKMRAQVALVQRQLRQLRAPPANTFYPVISAEDLKTWRTWLPTAYSDANSGFANYRFDLMPTEVLAELEFSRKLDLFDHYEIWTPEQPKAQDPVLVGYLDQTPYLLARWGESLMPFEKIQELVQRANEIRKFGDTLLLRFVLSAVLMVLTIPASIIYKTSNWPTAVFGIAIILTISSLFLYTNVDNRATRFLDQHRLPKQN